MDIHGEVKLVADNLLILASKFVGTVYAFGVPVCPIQAVFKNRDGKRMGKTCNKNPIKVHGIFQAPKENQDSFRVTIP